MRERNRMHTMEPRRILIVTPDSKLGGAERNMALLARFMPKDRFRFSLATTFGTQDLIRSFHEQGLAAEEFRFGSNPLRLADLYSYAGHLRPHLIHSFLLRGNWIAAQLARRRRVPWIASERGLDILRPGWKASVNRFMLSSASLVLAVSSPVRDILIARDRIPADRIRVLHGGIAPADPPTDSWASPDSRSAWCSGRPAGWPWSRGPRTDARSA